MSGVLLLGADYFGTLAATRCFGRAGIRVAVANDTKTGCAFHSRHVAEKLVHPPLDAPDALVDWLVAYGERHPGTFLYPPNDHLAWLFAAYGERLGRAFTTYAPAEDVVISLLDKARLNAACAKVGIAVPKTHVAGSANGSEAAAVAALGMPVLVKPRTQVYLSSGVKGFIADGKDALEREISRYRTLARFDPVLTRRHPEIAQPMLQEYLTAAETNIFSVSGFLSKEGDFACRAAVKVLQRPRKVGIGLCFESRPIEPALEKKLVALCKAIGYFGAFESEFVADGDRRLLIDFNPRFYSQMGFDIARGLPIPLLVYHAARRDAHALSRTLDEARAWKASGEEVYCHKMMLDLILNLQSLSGQMSQADARTWRTWYRTHNDGGFLTDAVRDTDDRKPAIMDTAKWVRHFARHPRDFVRRFVLNR